MIESKIYLFCLEVDNFLALKLQILNTVTLTVRIFSAWFMQPQVIGRLLTTVADRQHNKKK